MTRPRQGDKVAAVEPGRRGEAEVVSAPITGQRLEALSRPPWPWSARILLASLTLALLLSVAGLTIRALDTTETEYQIAARV